MSYPAFPPTQGYPPPDQNQPPPVGFAMPMPGGDGGGAYAPPSYPQPGTGGYPAPMAYPPPQGGAYPPPQGGAYPPLQGGAYPPPHGGAYPPLQQQGLYPDPGAGGYAPQHQGYMPPGQPITTQPGPQGENWMVAPQGPPNCPPGLEYLTMIDQLLVHQKVEMLEALTGFETKNKFSVKNSLGQKVYSAKESSGCLVRNCCGPIRPFDMKIMDNYNNQVIHLHRPLACQSCCFPCCLQSMEVTAPPGTVVGTVEQEWSILRPCFRVKDAAGNVVLKIKGPILTYSICGDVEFKVLSADGSQEVGRISKQWSGLLREAFTDTDYFGITFPMDLDVRMKAVMLGACFLIDAMFFEKKGNQEQDGIGMF